MKLAIRGVANIYDKTHSKFKLSKNILWAITKPSCFQTGLFYILWGGYLLMIELIKQGILKHGDKVKIVPIKCLQDIRKEGHLCKNIWI